MRRLGLWWCVVGMALAAVGCAAHERVVVRSAHCPGGMWVEEHYDAWAYWHGGHWRCPVRESVVAPG